jgi:hypothetical protein
MSTWARRRAGARRGHDSAQQGIPGEQRHGKVEVSIGSIGSSKAQRKERLGKGETDMDRKAPAPHCCVQAIEKELGAELPAAVVGHQGGRWRRGVGLPAFQKRERLGRERDIDLHGWWREEKKLGWLA